MTPHQVIAVAVRLFAVWLAIYLLRTAPSFYRDLTRAGDSVAGWAIIAISALAVVFILVLWFFPRTVARKLLDSNSLVTVETVSADTDVRCSGFG